MGDDGYEETSGSDGNDGSDGSEGGHGGGDGAGGGGGGGLFERSEDDTHTEGESSLSTTAEESGDTGADARASAADAAALPSPSPTALTGLAEALASALAGIAPGDLAAVGALIDSLVGPGAAPPPWTVTPSGVVIVDDEAGVGAANTAPGGNTTGGLKTTAATPAGETGIGPGAEVDPTTGAIETPTGDPRIGTLTEPRGDYVTGRGVPTDEDDVYPPGPPVQPSNEAPASPPYLPPGSKAVLTPEGTVIELPANSLVRQSGSVVLPASEIVEPAAGFSGPSLGPAAPGKPNALAGVDPFGEQDAPFRQSDRRPSLRAGGKGPPQAYSRQKAGPPLGESARPAGSRGDDARNTVSAKTIERLVLRRMDHPAAGGVSAALRGASSKDIEVVNEVVKFLKTIRRWQQIDWRSIFISVMSSVEHVASKPLAQGVVSSLGASRAGQPFDTALDAALHALVEYNFLSILFDREFAGFIYLDPASGKYSYTPAVIGTSSTSPLGAAYKLIPRGGVAVGDYHTHSDYQRLSDDVFSPQDKLTSGFFGRSDEPWTSYVATPHGFVGIYDGVTEERYYGPSSGFGDTEQRAPRNPPKTPPAP